SPAEVEALFRDLLIGVTSFFRDPEAFRMMENVVVPALFADQSPGSAIRIWTPGCSTGEEAYSIAILLVERMEALKVSFTVQIFSSDIDKRAIAIARAGVYPASIAADVSPERLARFFKLEEGGDTYRIHKSLRDLLIFSEQSVIKDPPFSKLDLICCRNLLIYLGSALQKQVIPLFHYALNPGGWLFLGTSEGVGDFGRLFGVLDRKAKVFRRSETQSGRHRPTSQGSGQFSTGVDVSMATARVRTKKGVTGRTSLRETTEQALLSHMIAAGALVTSRGDILYLHGRSGMFLEPSPGESGVNNIVKMARDGLRRELTSALHKAVSRGETVTSVGLRVRTNGHFSTVNLTVSPVIAGSRASADSPLYLVVLEESSFPYSPKVGLADDYASFGDDGLVPPDAVALIAALRLEMVSREEYIQTVSEELESSSEELKSSNEEMQSVNEELQSTNEELETSKEELQSVNEELATVNQELQEKVTDLSRANNDMNNLLAGTGIGTVFVDFQLRILRFTPAVSSIINLIASDVGRPVAHIVSNLVGYTSLVADVKAVLATLVPNEVRVHTVDGRTYTMHIRAYRTLDNVIEGAVISFLDVTDVAMEQVVLARTTARLRRTGAIAKIGGWELTLDNMQLTCSPESLLINDVSTPDGLSVDQAMAMVDPEYRAVQQVALEAAIEHGTPWDLEQRLTTAKGRRIWTRTQGIAEMVDGKVVRLHGAFHDITEQKQIEQTLRQANDLLRVALAVGDSRYAIIAHDLKGQTLAWNPGAVRMYGWTEAEALKINVRERLPELLRARLIDSPSAAHYLESNRTQRLTKDGKIVEVSTIATALLDPAGKVYAIATTERPIADDQS
ncbi:MAG: two-component system CheB/CheR fusion protein, partial [Kiritimatiellia bacterium]